MKAHERKREKTKEKSGKIKETILGMNKWINCHGQNTTNETQQINNRLIRI